MTATPSAPATDSTGAGAPLKVAIIIGSTRPGRRGAIVADWIKGVADARGDADYTVVDLADHPLPHLDEPLPPRAQKYSQDHTKAWSELIAGFDAFVFVTPEYNHSTTGVLKNAIDFLFFEWNDKAAGFVTYGAAAGGARAAEHLRLVLGELKVADVRAQVTLSVMDVWEDFRDPASFKPRDRDESTANEMLGEVVGWGTALRALRAGTLPA